MEFDDIHKVFIVSAGRTGTNFLGDFMQDVIPSSLTVHEPDTIVWRKDELAQKINRQGFINIFLLRALGIRGSKALSLKSCSGQISEEDALHWIRRDRQWVRNVRYYIEANTHLFGVVESLLKLPNSKLLFMVRDPRSWVRSGMNKSGWFDKKDFQERINKGGLKRLTPANVGVEFPNWDKASAFERLCWTWQFQNQLFMNHLKHHDEEQVHWLSFEDLFVHHDISAFKSMYRFITGETDGAMHANKFYNTLRQNKVNQTITMRFPSWNSWEPQHVQVLNERCGNLMRELGYGEEEAWLEMIARNSRN